MPVSGISAVSTIGWCMGDWYVWGGFGARAQPHGTFGPNLSRRAADFRDGLSSTLLASEVRSHQYERTNCGVLSAINTPSSVLPPDVPPTVVTPLLGSDGSPCTLSSAGHVSWADGSVDQSGMTTAWAPNTKVMVSLQDDVKLQSPSSADLDLVGTPEISGGRTIAAITSRSYHPGGVNVLFDDGSVPFHQGNDQRQHLAGLGFGERLRNHQRRAVLRKTPSLRSHSLHRIAWARWLHCGRRLSRQIARAALAGLCFWVVD